MAMAITADGEKEKEGKNHFPSFLSYSYSYR
jgi:hypothetical protein